MFASSASVGAGVAGGAGGMAVMRGVWAEMVALSSCSATSNANDRHVATLRSRQQLYSTLEGTERFYFHHDSHQNFSFPKTKKVIVIVPRNVGSSEKTKFRLVRS